MAYLKVCKALPNLAYLILYDKHTPRMVEAIVVALVCYNDVPKRLPEGKWFVLVNFALSV